jgi:hypothetical protein
MGDDITIGVTEIVNNIEVTAQPNDQIVDISVTDNADNVTLNITPTVVEVNINKGGSFAKWGDLYGTLSDQTDLQNALNAKANLVDGKVPASELPSYVDDIIEVANYAALPATGEIGKIYVTLNNNKIYRWSGSVYIEIASNSAIWGAITGTLSSQTDLQTALNTKVDKVTGKGLSTEDYTTTEKTKLSGIAEGAEVNVNADWNATTGDAQILNKPTIPSITGLVPYTGATGNVDLGTHKLTASDLVINHASGSGVAASITKGGNGEALTVLKTSGSGNAASITGGTTLLSELNLTTSLADTYIASAATWNAKQAALNGTGFVKISGTTISYDNSTYALDSDVVKVTTDQNVRGIKTFLGNQTATTLKLIVADYYNDGVITSDNGMLRLLNGTTELFNLASTGDLTAKSFVKTGGTSSQFLKANGTVDSTTYLSGTVAIANGGTGATTASAARTNLGATTIGSGIFTLPNGGLVSFLRVNADNSVELLGADLFRTSIGAGTGNGTVTSVNGTGSYGGLTLTGTVTGSGDLTLGGTPTGTWPISVSGNAASVNTVFNTTNADHYITFADANNGSPTAEFLYTVGTLKYNPNTGALTAGSFVKSGGTSSQFLMADGSVSTGSGGTVTGTGTTNYISKFTGSSAIGNSQIFDNGTNVGIGTGSPSTARFQVNSADNLGAPSLGSGAGATLVASVNGLYGLYTGTSADGYSWMQSTRNDGTADAYNIIMQPNGGNVGIGTTGAAFKLEVNGSTRITGGAEMFYLRNTTTNAMQGRIGVRDDGAMQIYSYQSGVGYKNILLAVDGSTSGGNVLIGTTTDAGYKLDVNGTARASVFSVNANGSISSSGYWGTLTTAGAGSYADWAVINSATTRIMHNPTGTLNMVFNGSVGIGTTSPATLLQLNSASGVNTTLSFSENGTLKWYNRHNAGDGSYQIVDVTNSATRLHITSGGNVGINTTSPLQKLQVEGSARVGASGYTDNLYRTLYVGKRAADAEGSIINMNPSAGNNNYGFDIGVIDNGTSGSQYFFIGDNRNSERMRIFGNGNVGINTTTDAGYKLDVNGSAFVRSGITAANNGTTSLYLANYLLSAGSSSGTTGLYMGDAGSGVNVLTREKYTVNTSYTRIYTEHGYNNPVKAVEFYNATSTFFGNVTAPGFFNSSDNRLKDLTDYDYNVSDIKPITYLWKDGRDNKKHVGYSAQEVQKVMPDAVNEDEKGFLSVNYVEVLVAKIAELENRIKQLEI